MVGSKDNKKPLGGSGLVSKFTNKLRFRPSSKATTTKTDGNRSTDEGQPLKSTVAQAGIDVTDNGEPEAGGKSQAGKEPLVVIKSTTVSTSPLPDTNHEESSKTRASNKETESSQEVSSQATSVISPIRELWNQAYDDLRGKEANLVKDYETTLYENLTAMIISDSILGREDQMKIILEEKVEEVKKNMWKLQFGASEVPVKDLVQPVVGIIDWANQYINAAVSSNPYASLAWAGVGLLLPVSNSSLNHFTCRESRLSIFQYLLSSILM
jgi:hypothetical protein